MLKISNYQVPVPKTETVIPPHCNNRAAEPNCRELCLVRPVGSNQFKLKAIFRVTKNDKLKIGYKMARKTKSGDYFGAIWDK